MADSVNAIAVASFTNCARRARRSSHSYAASGPPSPTPGAPYTYVTTKHFLTAFGIQTLRDLPDIEALEDAGLLSRKGEQEEALVATGGGEE